MEPQPESQPQIRVLGDLGLVRDGERVRLGPRLRRLLAVMAVHRGDVVSTDGLIDAVWGADPPDAAEATLRSYITRLRNAALSS